MIDADEYGYLKATANQPSASVGPLKIGGISRVLSTIALSQAATRLCGTLTAPQEQSLLVN